MVNENDEKLRFTAALSNGSDLYAFRYAENDTPNTLYFREEHGEVVVVSEPFDQHPSWTMLPANYVLSASRDRVAIEPFMELQTPRGNAQQRRTLIASEQ
jgi:glutamine amidotransferase